MHVLIAASPNERVHHGLPPGSRSHTCCGLWGFMSLTHDAGEQRRRRPPTFAPVLSLAMFTLSLVPSAPKRFILPLRALPLGSGGFPLFHRAADGRGRSLSGFICYQSHRDRQRRACFRPKLSDDIRAIRFGCWLARVEYKLPNHRTSRTIKLIIVPICPVPKFDDPVGAVTPEPRDLHSDIKHVVEVQRPRLPTIGYRAEQNTHTPLTTVITLLDDRLVPADYHALDFRHPNRAGGLE